MSLRETSGRVSYPIMVERFTGDQALMLACYAGEGHPPWRAKDPEDFIEQLMAFGRCPTCNTPQIGEAYVQADVCANCGTKQIGMPLGRYCSRKCELQHEYAKSLNADRAGVAAVPETDTTTNQETTR